MATLAPAPAPTVRSRPGVRGLLPRRLGLRSRITLAFAIGAFVLSTLFAFVTYAFTRSAIVRQRDRTAVQEAQRNTRLIQPVVDSSPALVQAQLASLGSGKLLQSKPDWAANQVFLAGLLAIVAICALGAASQARLARQR